MDNSNIFLAVKAAIVGVFGAFGAAFGWLGWLVLAWVACMAVDWLSGSSAAMQAGQWSSACLLYTSCAPSRSSATLTSW